MVILKYFKFIQLKCLFSLARINADVLLGGALIHFFLTYIHF